MCNHYRANARAIEDWAVWSGQRPTVEIPDEVWPRRPATVVRLVDRQPVAETMTWGIPLETMGKSGKPIVKSLTNVRSLGSAFWKWNIARPEYRCLVPFTSFAEPRPGKDLETGRPAEWWFTVPGEPISAFAGIWRPGEGGPHFAFLTCEPNPLIAPRHPKAMPVILHPDQYRTWLTGYYAEVCALASPFPSQLMAVSAASEQ